MVLMLRSGPGFCKVQNVHASFDWFPACCAVKRTFVLACYDLLPYCVHSCPPFRWAGELGNILPNTTMDLASIFWDFLTFWLLLAVPSVCVRWAVAESREAIAFEELRAGLQGRE